MTGAEDRPDPLADAMIAARLCAIDPAGLGGMVLRGGSEARDAVIAAFAATMPAGAPVRRLPTHIDDERLLGGLDLAATLALGRPVARAGLLAEADGGVVIVPMAERLSDAIAAPVAAALDSGEIVAEREGQSLRSAARFAVVALDDGAEPDERPPAALIERLAFQIDLTGVCSNDDAIHAWVPALTSFAAASDWPAAGDDVLQALAHTAAVLGVESARAPLFALRAARALAQLEGRARIAEADVALAARLVLAPRATRLPPAPEAEAEAPPEPPPPEPPPPADTDAGSGEQEAPAPLDDLVLEAVLASLPRDVLAKLASDARRGPHSRARGKGERRRSPRHGRPVGVRAGVPRGGLRLSLIDTLRAAAPWQRLRGAGAGRVRIARDDLRIRRFEARAEAVTIFAVDASGSAALTRLAEAKGAVELLLAEAYVKRAQVALVAFRGTGAELLLPPTRSLARARKSLAALPGGGGTPLAAGLAAALELGEAARKRGRTPFIVVLTDGQANIAADGRAVRGAAGEDAENAARAIGLAGIGAAFVDISPRPRPEGERLAAAMRARYLPLPRADARAMHAAVKQAQHAG